LFLCALFDVCRDLTYFDKSNAITVPLASKKVNNGTSGVKSIDGERQYRLTTRAVLGKEARGWKKKQGDS
jgi:hypothetical protein